MTEEEMKALEDIIAYHLRGFKEDLCRKFDLLIEGQKILAAKLDRAGGLGCRMRIVETARRQ